jgi:periplasmic copper chaperone A
MMKNILATAGLLAVVLVAMPMTLRAHDYKAGPLHIDHPWARAPIGTVPNTAAYMKIENSGDTDDRLVSAKSDVAKTVMLHESRMVGDVMKMVHLDKGIPIPAHGSAELKPLGLHVMIMGLKQPLKKGESFPMTLVFEKQGEVPVEVKVGAPSGAKKDGEMHDHH